MGIGFVLIFWAIFGLIAASAGGAVLAGAVAWMRRRTQIPKTTLLVAAIFPFACLGWSGAVFVSHAVINEGLLHRDPWIGDSWHAPLPNGFEVSFIDVTDQGSLSPINSYSDGSPSIVTLSGVRSLQVAGPFLIGAIDSDWLAHLGTESSAVDEYFILDTRDQKKTTTAELDQLKAMAKTDRIQVKLEPIYSVYARYRYTWFDAFTVLLLVLPPLGGLSSLVWWFVRLRRQQIATG